MHLQSIRNYIMKLSQVMYHEHIWLLVSALTVQQVSSDVTKLQKQHIK